VAIIDFLMSGLNGAEVARLAIQQYSNFQVIFISGYSDTLALDGIPNATILHH
jgi:DNA-binding NarL/FixJ family response regulator